MAKCKALTGSAVKGLKTYTTVTKVLTYTKLNLTKLKTCSGNFYANWSGNGLGLFFSSLGPAPAQGRIKHYREHEGK